MDRHQDSYQRVFYGEFMSWYVMSGKACLPANCFDRFLADRAKSSFVSDKDYSYAKLFARAN